MKTIDDIKTQMKQWQNQEVDIVYHPFSNYRMMKYGKAKIRQLYDNFFEVEVFTKEYGSYRTTISYIDVYTGGCKVMLHMHEHS